MIQPGANSRVSPQESESDGSVADVPQIGARLVRFITHSGSDLVHSKDAFVELRHLFVTLCINRHVRNSSKHELILLSLRIRPETRQKMMSSRHWQLSY